VVADTGNLGGFFLDAEARLGQHAVLGHIAGVAVHFVNLLESEDGEFGVAGKNGGEIANVEFFVSGLRYDAVALLCHGDSSAGSDISGDGDVLESEHAG